MKNKMMLRLKSMLGLFLLTLFFFSANAQWQQIETATQPTARHESGFAACGDFLYLIGGRGSKAVERFDPITATWTRKSYPPLEMHHITPVAVGEMVYIVGGLTGKYPEEQPLTHVYIYNPVLDTWAKDIEIPKARRRGGGGVAVKDAKIYLVGGITFGHTSGTNGLFDVYDVQSKSWTSLKNAPNIRDHSAASIIGDQLISLGGRNTSYHEPDNFMAFFEKVVAQVDVYDFEKEEWRTMKEKLPIPSAGGGVVSYQGKLIYMAGETGARPARNQVFMLDFNKKSWTALPTLNQGRHGTNAVIVGRKIYIAAGSGNQGGGPELNSIESLELKTE